MREISAGIIIYRKIKISGTNRRTVGRDGTADLKFLLLYHGRGYWNFPKGKIESEEKSLQAALREIREETGLTSNELKLINGFKTYEKFSFWKQLANKNVKVFKIIILYLAETKKKVIKISELKEEGEPHEGFAWFTYYEALKVLTNHKSSQRVLKQAYNFLKTRHFNKN